MSKYNHNAKARKGRTWQRNVGDGGDKSRKGINPNDGRSPR